MLFRYRPRETWMPYSLPRQRTDQAAYNRSLQRQFASARRAPDVEPSLAPPPPPPAPSPERIRADIDALLEAGALTVDEHRAATERLDAS